MKTYIFLFFLIFFSQTIFSQNKISVFYGFSDNALLRKAELIGGPGYAGKGSNLYGFSYEKALFKYFSLETGLEYSKNKIEITPNFYPGIDMTPKNVDIEILTVPIYANYTFLKYIFVNGGALIDFELNREEYASTDNQSGIGFGIGIGGKYDFNDLTVFVNPFYRSHAIIPFEKENYHQHLNEIGLKFGIGYNF